jgi:hypothetical protein
MALPVDEDATIQSLTSLVLDSGQLNHVYQHFWIVRVVPMLREYVHLPNYDTRVTMRFAINDMLTRERNRSGDMSHNIIDHIVEWVNH